MRWALIALALLALGAWLGPDWAGNTGYVMIAVGAYTLETSVVFALFALLVVGVVLRLVWRLLWRLVHSTQVGARWFGARRASKAATAHQQGLAALLASDYVGALAAFGNAYRYEASAERTQLAAFAAQQGAQPEALQLWLDRLQDISAAKADDLRQEALNLSQLLLTLRMSEEVPPALLQQLRDTLIEHPTHPQLLQAALRAYQQAHAWEDLQHLLPQVRLLGMHTESELSALEQQVYTERFKQKGHAGLETLKAFWEQLGRSERRRQPLRYAYVKALLLQGHTEIAGKVLTRGLEKYEMSLADALRDELVQPGSNQLLNYLQARLKRKTDDVSALHALGYLALKTEDYSLAQRALKRATELAPSPLLFKLLAQAYQALGDTQLALNAYSKA